MIKERNYKWIILISFLALIFLPKQMPAAFLKYGVIILASVICLFFEFASLKNSNPSETKQTWLLMALTLIMSIVNFIV